MRYAYEAAAAPKSISQRSDRIRVDLERLELPTPHVVPVSEADLPPIPAPGADVNPFHYQSLILDLDTGALTFACEDWRQKERQEDDDVVSWISADPFRETFGSKTRPGRTLEWVVSTGTVFVPYLTAAEGNALAERALPYARTLAEGLLRLQGRADYDFSAAAAVAGSEIDRLTGTRALAEALPPERRGESLGSDGDTETKKVFDAADLLNSAALERTFYQYDIAQATDDTLIDEAFSLGMKLGRQTPGGEHPEWAGLSLVDVVGTRAALFAVRSKLTEGRTPVPAAEWFSRSPEATKGLTANSSTSDLEQAAQAAQAKATLAGVQITGITEYLLEQRREWREDMRWALEKSGREVSSMESSLRKERAKRSSLLLSVLSWEEGDSDADLGRTASMSRQGVQQLRERAMSAEQEDDQ